MPSTREIDSGHVPQQAVQPDFQMQIEPDQFLMRSSTGATPSIVFTPIYGFAGNVTLSAYVSPAKPSAPTISYLPASIKLNASIPGSPAYSMGINTTLTTPLGLYTVTVLGVSGSISHTASATIGVTDVFVPSNGAELVYMGNFTGAAYAGRPTTLNNTFEDLGYVTVGVWNVTVSLSFGIFRDTGGTYTLNPYQEKTTSLTFGIPSDISPGNYSVTVTIRWLLEPYTIYQTSGPDLLTYGSIIVYSTAPGPAGLPSLNGLPTVFLAIVGGVVASAAIMFVLLSVMERRRKDSFRRLSATSGTIQPMTVAKSCGSCGTTVIESRFCPKCGSPLA